MPIVTDVPVDDEFLNKFNLVQTVSPIESYMGVSKCRVCDCCNGNGEYFATHNGVTFRFPNGLEHYYRDHNVHPSPEFREFIMNFDL